MRERLQLESATEVLPHSAPVATAPVDQPGEGTRSRRKLLFLVTEDWYFCSHRLPLAVAARDAGYDVSVLTRVRAHGETIVREGFNLVPISMVRRRQSLAGEVASVREIAHLYRELKPDLVHHVALKPVVYGSIAARMAGVRRVVNAVAGLGWLFASEDPRARFLRRFSTVAFRTLLRRGRVIVQNPDDREVLVGAGLRRERIALIRGSGVRTDEFTMGEEEPDTALVVLASRMLWAKGVGEFVEAAQRLRKRGIDARFALAGTPDVENAAAIPQEMLRRWQAEGSVEWWGHCEDMPGLFRRAHIVCLPSYYREGVPKVLIEAAACGRPIVTTDTPGCREIVRDGENGLLVPPRDAAALADAIERLIRDPALRRRMGERGREIATTEFSVESVVRQTLSVYDELLQE